MIQRIQSLFLLLCSAALLLLFVFPFASSEIKTQGFLTDKIYNIQDHMGLLAMTVIPAGLALMSIFLFKNRKLQLKLGYFTVVFSILLILLSIVLFYNEASSMLETRQIDDGLGLYLPILAVIFALLANRFISKDDKLVKSMDRLR